MIRPSLLILLLLYSLKFNAQADNADHKLNELALRFFNIEPKGKNAKEIIKTLTEVLGLQTDTLIKKTDTSLFYYRGYSDRYNPFGINSKKIEIQFRESIAKEKESLLTLDTLLFLQLIAVVDSSLENLSLLEKEVRKIHKEISSFFTSYNEQKSRKRDNPAYHFYNYYYRPFALPIITLGWSASYNKQPLSCLTLTLTYRNLSDYPPERP